MGVSDFFSSAVSLAGASLNLGAWFGYHDVYSETMPLDWQRVRFHFRLEPKAYLILSLRDAVKSRSFLGWRLSAADEMASARLRVDELGYVRELVPFSPTGSSPIHARWLEGELVRSGGEVQLWIEGREVNRMAYPARQPAQLSFRAGPSVRTQIDSIRVTGPNGFWEETFHRPLRLQVFFSVAAGLLAIAFLWSWFWGVGYALYVTVLVTMGTGAFFYIHETHLIHLYPTGDSAKRRPHPSQVGGPHPAEGPSQVTERLRREIRTRPSCPRVLWLGGSQTWGAGASERRMSWAAKLADMLGKEHSGLCFGNIAVSGQNVKQQTELLASLPAEMKLAAVVAVVGANDNNPRIFEESLRQLIQAVEKRGARLLIVSEPSNHVPKKMGSNAEIGERVAKDLGVSFFDLRAEFPSNEDGGLWWWDFVHFTDAGNDQVAKRLFPAVNSFLRGLPVR